MIIMILSQWGTERRGKLIQGDSKDTEFMGLNLIQ